MFSVHEWDICFVYKWLYSSYAWNFQKKREKGPLNSIVYVICREKRDVAERGKIFQGESLKEWLTTKIAIGKNILRIYKYQNPKIDFCDLTYLFSRQVTLYNTSRLHTWIRFWVNSTNWGNARMYIKAMDQSDHMVNMIIFLSVNFLQGKIRYQVKNLWDQRKTTKEGFLESYSVLKIE